MATVPPSSDALAFLPSLDALANGSNTANHLMSGSMRAVIMTKSFVNRQIRRNMAECHVMRETTTHKPTP